MTYEEATELIEKNIKRNACIPKDRDWWNNALDMALEALDKQIPKKPILEADGYADGELVYDTWFCPNCDKSYEIDFDDYDFCPNCGQKIDGRDEDGKI